MKVFVDVQKRGKEARKLDAKKRKSANKEQSEERKDKCKITLTGLDNNYVEQEPKKKKKP